ncbi:MAG: hypothetical protein CMJ20_04925 [Phycisphaeraceae bacterium]|nr:hypothetical protein [Phycisphaeraceae bacterium]
MLVNLDQLDADIIALREQLVEITRDLVRINTVNPYSGDRQTPSHGEVAGQRYIENTLKNLGATSIEVFEPREGIYERMGVRGPKERSFKDRPNILGHFQFPQPGPAFLINSHMDTVGVDGMVIDPFSAELKDGRIHGRGSADQKGLLTAALIAVEAILKQRDRLCGELIVMSVVDEECNGAGAGTLACVEQGLKADAGILTDGFDYKLCHTSKGMITAEIFVAGESGHCSSPDSAVSAIDNTVVVKKGIDRFIQSRKERNPSLAINLGVMRSGVLPSVVPNDGYLALNAEYSVQEVMRNGKPPSGEPIRTELAAAITEQIDIEKHPWLKAHPPRVELLKDFPPVEVDPDQKIVRDALHAARAILGPDVTYDQFIPTCDGGHLVLKAGIPMVFFGTAELAQCHTPHESVAVDDLMCAARIYGRLTALQMSQID